MNEPFPSEWVTLEELKVYLAGISLPFGICAIGLLLEWWSR